MRCCSRRRRVAIAASMLASIVLFAGSLAAQSPTYGVGRPPTPDEIKAVDISITPSGRELPEGRGTAANGKTLYTNQCARCHGATGKEGPQDVIAGGAGTLTTPKPLKTVGSYWPYATTLWDYINRAMPFDRPGTLSPDQVYESVAYVLFLNGIVGEQDTIDAKTLRAIVMPNRTGFIADERPDVGARTKTTKPKTRKKAEVRR